MKAIQNGWLLASPYPEHVIRGRLRNGHEMLFLPREVQRFETNPDEREAATNVLRVVAALPERGFDVRVLLVPMKYTVYRPLLQGADGHEPSRPFLTRLEHRLRDSGIMVVNLLAPFQAAAADAMERDRTIYWRDDTHWNAAGVGIAAGEVREAWIADAPRPASP
jgi:hypothetical protein